MTWIEAQTDPTRAAGWILAIVALIAAVWATSTVLGAAFLFVFFAAIIIVGVYGLRRFDQWASGRSNAGYR